MQPALAFPAQFFDERATGMTLRDYFAARAPAVPQEWFFPVLRPCPMVPSPYSIKDMHLRALVIGELNGNYDPSDPEAVKWIEARDAIVKQQEEWQADFRRELCLQWPYAWADAILDKR